jgi:hypothetical protein
MDASLVLVWVVASPQTCYERMKKRNSSRDRLKLANWDAYLQKTDRSIPRALQECGAVDVLFPFDNEDERTAGESLDKFLKMMGEMNG